MPKHIKICRICGKEYEACRSSHRSDTTFRWQDVACSIECGMKYLEKIEKSRTRKPNIINVSKSSDNIVLTDNYYSMDNKDFNNDWGESLDDDSQFGNTIDIE